MRGRWMTRALGDHQMRFILSSGRTGTVFLSKFLARYAPEACAVHEPAPTRWQMMFANFHNDTGLFRTAISHWFRAAHRKRCSSANTYIEINPFLCALSEFIPDSDHTLRIVHLTREPLSWAHSMTTFKASRKFRWIIDYVPFAKPNPAPRPDGWRQMPELQRSLWRWVWCNSRISELREKTDYYVQVKYEDLFSEDLNKREAALRAIFDTLDLPWPEEVNWSGFVDKVNPAPTSKVQHPSMNVAEIARPLAASFGYAD